jgi:valyl-tRNA synthetase
MQQVANETRKQIQDTAICVSILKIKDTTPHGKTHIVPIMNRETCNCREYVDDEPGTAFENQPAHDENDKKEIGEARFTISHADATLNSFGLHYQGKDRFRHVRK